MHEKIEFFCMKIFLVNAISIYQDDLYGELQEKNSVFVYGKMPNKGQFQIRDKTPKGQIIRDVPYFLSLSP